MFVWCIFKLSDLERIRTIPDTSSTRLSLTGTLIIKASVARRVCSRKKIALRLPPHLAPVGERLLLLETVDSVGG
jgi:hypothetical protein